MSYRGVLRGLSKGDVIRLNAGNVQAKETDEMQVVAVADDDLEVVLSSWHDDDPSHAVREDADGEIAIFEITKAGEEHADTVESVFLYGEA